VACRCRFFKAGNAVPSDKKASIPGKSFDVIWRFSRRENVDATCFIRGTLIVREVRVCDSRANEECEGKDPVTFNLVASCLVVFNHLVLLFLVSFVFGPSTSPVRDNTVLSESEPSKPSTASRVSGLPRSMVLE